MIINSPLTGRATAADPKTRQGRRNHWATRAAGSCAAVVLSVLAWGCPPLHAAMLVQKMDLPTLSRNADAIVRATVIDIEPGSVRAGGGDIPTITYRLQVKETVAGKARGVLDLTMVGDLKAPVKVGGATRVSPFSDMPTLKKGQEYLLFTTRPSGAGLSTTVGLGQGCFTVYAQDKKELAVNSINNAGLASAAGPLEYGQLVQRIRKIRAK